MSNYFDRCASRKGTDSWKWDMLRQRYGDKDLMPFHIADMEFETPPAIREALIERIAHPVFSYTYPGDSYYQSIINWYQARHQVAIDADEIIFTPGVMLGLCHILNAITEPSDKVLINTPVYNCFANMLGRMDRTIVDAPLRRNDDFYTLDLEAIERELRNGAKAYIFCTPHNPVGRVWTRDEIARVAELCYRYHVPLLADEIHSDLVFKGHKHIPTFSVSPEAEQCTIVLNSSSKTFNIAGVCSAYMIVKNPDYRALLKKALARFNTDGGCFAFTATTAGYQHCAAWVDGLVDYIEGNARFVCDYLRENLPQVKTYVPEGTFLMWLDFTHYQMTQSELMSFLVDKAGLVLSDGTTFGKDHIGFARLNIGAPRAFVEEGLTKLVSTFTTIKN